MIFHCHLFGERCIYLINPVSTEYLPTFIELDQVAKMFVQQMLSESQVPCAGVMAVQSEGLPCASCPGVGHQDGEWML